MRGQPRTNSLPVPTADVARSGEQPGGRRSGNDVGHELRNPLNAMLGHAQLLAMDDLLPQQREAVNAIIGAGTRLLQLIESHFDESSSDDER